MFQPPRCPNRRCPRHAYPAPRFLHSKRLLPPNVPRGCRPALQSAAPAAVASPARPSGWTTATTGHTSTPRSSSRSRRGVGIRQTARNVGLSLRCTELKLRKIARHLRRLNLNLRGPLPPGSQLQFDELETYEGRRNTRPLTLPVLIERESRFVIWAESAPIRPHGRMSEARRQAVRQDEKRYGPRKDRSRRAVRRTLERGAVPHEEPRASRALHGREAHLSDAGPQGVRSRTPRPPPDEQQARPRQLEPTLPDQPHRGHGT